MTHRAAENAPQHISAALVRREHAVRQQERHRARMVGEHAERRGVDRIRHDVRPALPAANRHAGARLVALAAPVVDPNRLLHRRDQRREEIGVEDHAHALRDRRDAFESGAGVDRRLGQRDERSVGLPVVLHEHEVPELEEPVLVRSLDERLERKLVAIELGPFTRRAVGKAPIRRDVRDVDEDLGARSARTGVGHLPEVVLVAESVDARIGKAGDLPPQLARFVVAVVHGDAQVFRVEPELGRDELPREPDRVALEVVAEREVAQHLEEGVVPGRVPHLLEIVVLAAGAHALLRRRCATLALRRVFHAEEDLLELHHAGVREQQRRIVGGHERRARANRVAVAREILEETGADFGGKHIR